MAYDEKTRENIYRYRQKHKEKVLEQQRKDCKRYYEKNREKILERQRLYRQQKTSPHPTQETAMVDYRLTQSECENASLMLVC